MMQMSPEEIWDPDDPHKYYTPRDLGDNFFLLERTSAIKKVGGGGGGEGEEEVNRVSRKENGDDGGDDDVGVYILIETDVSQMFQHFHPDHQQLSTHLCNSFLSPLQDGKVTVAPAKTENGEGGSGLPPSSTEASGTSSKTFTCPLCDFETANQTDLEVLKNDSYEMFRVGKT